MIKLNDEQLSRVLSAHENDQLETYGCLDNPIGRKQCIYQAAFDCTDLNDIPNNIFNEDNALTWFDSEYTPAWTIEEFLAKIEKIGLI